MPGTGIIVANKPETDRVPALTELMLSKGRTCRNK